MQRWAYRTAQYLVDGLDTESGASALEGDLNRLGAAGWELVTSATYRSPDAQQDVIVFTLKRPVAFDLD